MNLLETQTRSILLSTYIDSIKSRRCDFVCVFDVDICNHFGSRAVYVHPQVFVAKNTFTANKGYRLQHCFPQALIAGCADWLYILIAQL